MFHTYEVLSIFNDVQIFNRKGLNIDYILKAIFEQKHGDNFDFYYYLILVLGKTHVIGWHVILKLNDIKIILFILFIDNYLHKS